MKKLVRYISKNQETNLGGELDDITVELRHFSEDGLYELGISDLNEEVHITLSKSDMLSLLNDLFISVHFL